MLLDCCHYMQILGGTAILMIHCTPHISLPISPVPGHLSLWPTSPGQKKQCMLGHEMSWGSQSNVVHALQLCVWRASRSRGNKTNQSYNRWYWPVKWLWSGYISLCFCVCVCMYICSAALLVSLLQGDIQNTGLESNCGDTDSRDLCLHVREVSRKKKKKNILHCLILKVTTLKIILKSFLFFAPTFTSWSRRAKNFPVHTGLFL